MSTPSLADLPAGFADPVHETQQVFRRLLDAMSRPGRIYAVDAARLSPPAGLGAAAAAVLLSLADPELRVWLCPSYAEGRLADWLRFHTGARIVASPEAADWLVLPAASASPELWSQAGAGTDEAPHTSATLLIDLPQLGDAPRLRLRGPGIEHEHTLAPEGLEAAFWRARIAREADFPRGADLVLACGERLAALPRSTRIALED
ncbi:phosphonate C-P lyase system protein PhnH [Aquabacterium sp. A7-Y]|uniref:phosphonate C-P lyase system protein PhnH n=1 Tax=Aquabacterium sp. A7-Y TaxID=1349605 RepID=UPI00223CA02D|nr:phosphonate C-P lyase system protein PhnH [Aquabacterium sp. A7-Y]MCW7541332.1 phosphonate C-P lyase system protein PhnH [Aquabacterium sp. A7-Y]